MLNDKVKKFLSIFFVILILSILGLYFWNFLNRERVVFENWDGKGEIITGKNVFHLKGQAFFMKNIYLDSKEYFLDENNNFDIPVGLYPGFNQFYFKSLAFSGEEIEKKIIVMKK